VSALRTQPVAGGVRLWVRVQPRASVSEVAGIHGDALKVRLTSPPVEGAANEALVKLLAATFGIPQSAVTIVAGASSRSKVVELAGLTEERVRSMVEHDA
jgi:uncharacterized protein (TIGR00251 family)